jgi:hypothetical protein
VQLATGLILSPVVNELHFNGPFLLLATNLGLLVGAIFWSVGCEIWGRKSARPIHLSLPVFHPRDVFYLQVVIQSYVVYRKCIWYRNGQLSDVHGARIIRGSFQRRRWWKYARGLCCLFRFVRLAARYSSPLCQFKVTVS